MRSFIGFLVGCCLAFHIGFVAAEDFKAIPLTGRVVDQANLLSYDDKTFLSRGLEEHEVKTSQQVVVVTVRSLDGYSVEDYANRLFNAWGLGQKDKNKGVLFLIAPHERKVRIEVGYGLEGVLPDATASHIIQHVVLPAFRNQQFSQGIIAGTQAILQVLVGEPVSETLTVFGQKPLRSSLKLSVFDAAWVGTTLIFIVVGFFHMGRRVSAQNRAVEDDKAQPSLKERKPLSATRKKVIQFLTFCNIGFSIACFISFYISSTLFLVFFLLMFMSILLINLLGGVKYVVGYTGGFRSGFGGGGSFGGGGGSSGGGGASGGW